MEQTSRRLAVPAREQAVERRTWRRAAPILAGCALAVLFLVGPGARLADLLRGADWGSDWRWLEDGLRRLAAGLPLTDPRYVAGPWSQFDPGPAYTWSLQPPFVATLIAPALALPDGLRTGAWMLAADLAILAAFAIAWPRSRDWRVHALVAGVLIGPPVVGLGVAFVDQVHYVNPNAFVALGVVLAWEGRRRGRAGLIAAGLVLAAWKIVPAIALGCWLLPAVRTQPAVRRGIAAALVVLVALTLPVLALDRGAISDMLRSQANLVPTLGPANLSPRAWLAPLLGVPAAALVTVGVGVLVLVGVAIRRLDGPGGLLVAMLAACCLTPQLWSHWLLVPAVAGIILVARRAGVAAQRGVAGAGGSDAGGSDAGGSDAGASPRVSARRTSAPKPAASPEPAGASAWAGGPRQ